MSELPDLPPRPRRAAPLPADGAQSAMESGRRRRVRQLAVASGIAVALTGAAAGAVAALGGSDSLSTAEAPAPSAEVSPSATASPTPQESASPSASPSPSTTPAALPERYVAAVGRELVVDRVARSAARVLDRYDASAAEGSGEGEPKSYLAGVELSPEGSIAYADVCCEPAAGRTERVPLDAPRNEDDYLSAFSPAVSPDGRSLAGFSLDFLVRCALDAPELRTGCTSLTTSQPELAGRGGLAWSPDGSTLAFRETPIGADGPDPRAAASIRLVRAVAQPSLSDGRLLAPPDGQTYAAPVFRADGMLVVARQDVDPDSPTAATGVVLDPNDGRVLAEFALDDRVVDQDYDRSGTYLLTTYRSGRLAWQGAGSGGVLRTSGVSSAAW